MKKFVKIAGSGLFTGYFPYAPGTIGSILALIIYLIVPGFTQFYIIIPLIIITFLLGVNLGSKFEAVYGKDPKQFTLDEFVGTWIALLLTPNSFWWLLFSLIVWRILDILKPYPANKMENLNGGFGIMMDDVVSGMYSLIIIFIFKFIIY